MSSRIYIEGEQVETYADQVVTVTYQRNSVGNPNTRQTSFSNDFRLPVSRLNRNILKGAELISSGDRPEYRTLTGTIFSTRGIPVLPDGRFTIKSVGRDFTLQAYSGYRQLTEAIKGKNLWDLSNIAQWDHFSITTTIINSFPNTEGYVYGLFQDGTLTEGTDGSVFKGFELMLPQYYFHSILKEIIEDAGFEVDETTGLFTDEFFRNIVFAFSKDKLVLSERIYPNINLSEGTPQTFTASHPRIEPAEFRTIGVLEFGGTTTVVEGFARQLIDISATIKVTGISATFLSAPNILDANFQSGAQLALIDQDDNVLGASAIIVGAGEYTLSVDDYDLANGDTLRLAIVGAFFNQEITVSIDNATVDTSSQVKELVEGIKIGAEMVLPEDLTQENFLKAILVGFSVIPIERAGKISFEFWDSLLDNTGDPIDLSPYLLKPNSAPPHQWYKSKRTNLGNYGQNNILEYKEDNDKQVNFRLRRGNIPCTDENLPPERTFYTFPFAASDRYTTANGIHMMDARTWVDGEFVGNIEQRIGYIRRQDAVARIGPSSPNLAQDVPFVQFIHPEESINLHPLSLISNYHKVQRLVLDDPLILVCELNLPATIFQLIDNNPNRPVWVDKLGGYYYVNKIPNFLEGTVSDVELVRLM